MTEAVSSAPPRGGYRSRIVLVDPAFSSDRAGHHWRLNLGYAQLFGLERCWFAAHRTLRRAKGIPPERIVRAFATSPYEAEELRRLGRVGVAIQTLAYRDAAPVPPGVRQVIQSVLRRRRRHASASPAPQRLAPLEPSYRTELIALIDGMGLGPNDHLVFISLDSRMGRAVIELAVERGLAVLPALHLRLMYDQQTPSEGGLDYAGLYERIAALGDTGGRLTVHCETAVHAEALAKVLDAPVGVAPFPATGLPAAPGLDAGRFTVAFLGEARVERGFELVAPVMEAFRARHPDLVGRTSWRIHAGGTTAEATASRDALRGRARLDGPDASFLLGSITPGAYDRLRASADIILAPQDPGVYAVRGSGVAQEAVAGGRPLVCLAGSSLEKEQDAAVAAGRTIEDLADAIADIVRSPEIWFARAQEGALRFTQRLLDSDLVQACAQPAPVRPDRPIALLVGPWWPQGGSARLMALQALTLHTFGYQVVRAHLVRPGGSAQASLTAAMRGPDRDRATALSFATPATGEGWSAWTNAPVDERLKTLCSSGRIQLLVVNFAQCAAWARKLPLPKNVASVLETHELALDAASGRSLSRPAAPPEGFDAAVFVNAEEARLWRTQGQANCALIIPPLDDRGDRSVDASAPSYDLIFVGSDHARNRIALDRLLHEILRHPDMQDVTLAIVGDVRATPGADHPGAVALGRVSDLDAAYADARLVVAPVAPGGGLPSKVMGALCRGAPLVADPEAVAFLEDPEPFSARDDADFRRRIRLMLADPEQAARCAERSRRAWARLAEPGRHVSEWRSLLEAIGALPIDASRSRPNRV